MQQNASFATRPLSWVGHALEHHDAVGELRMFTAQRAAGEREDAGVVRRFEQRLDQESADQSAGSRDQRNSWRRAHGAKLNKQTW